MSDFNKNQKNKDKNKSKDKNKRENSGVKDSEENYSLMLNRARGGLKKN